MYRAIIIILFFYSPVLYAVPCAEGVIDSQNSCVVTDKNFFVYKNNPYGGRGSNGVDVVSTILGSVLSVPVGFYNDKVAIWSSDYLDASYIKKGVTLFGIAGELDGDTNYPDCNLNDNNVSPYENSKNPSCFVPSAGQYFYNSPYGGRSQNCIFDTQNTTKVTNSPCWLTAVQTANSVVRSVNSYDNCPFGLVTSLCTQKRTEITGYYYSTAYNGRSTVCCDGNAGDCTIAGNSAAACLISSSQVPAIKTTTVVCNENGNVKADAMNSINCNTATVAVNGQTSRYVYSQPYGGRDNCLDDNSGSCWWSGALKTSISSGLEINNITGKLKYIKKDVTVFGLLGEYEATAISYGSGASRTKSANASSNLITYNDEKALTQQLHVAKSQYHPIPKISLDSDGYGKSSQVTSSPSLGTTTCGNVNDTDSIDTRISQCGVSWDGRAKGNSGQNLWQLVLRKSQGGKYHEVWKDTVTGLLWSSLVHNGTNWCKASGSNNSSAVTSDDLKNPDPSEICNKSSYQNTTTAPLSACFEDGDFDSTLAGAALGGKGGLGFNGISGNTQVHWRLPTMYDFILANHHGLRFVLPDIGQEEWSATISAGDVSMAWIFDSTNGIFQRRSRKGSMGVRCVGR